MLRQLIHFTVMFNYVNFHNLILASRRRFHLCFMHILHKTAGVIEYAQMCYIVCLVRYTANPAVVKEMIHLYYSFLSFFLSFFSLNQV